MTLCVEIIFFHNIIVTAIFNLKFMITYAELCECPSFRVVFCKEYSSNLYSFLKEQ